MAIEVKGVEEAVRNFQELPEKTQKRVLTVALRRGAEVARRAVVAGAPVDKGTLKRSIRLSKGRPPDKNLVIWNVRATVFYSRFLEFGTRQMEKKEWMWPAFEGAEDAITRAIEQSFVANVELALRGR